MTLPRLQAMTEYWLEHPPVHILVAAYMRIKPKGKKVQGSQDAEKMMAEFAAAGFEVKTIKKGD